MLSNPNSSTAGFTNNPYINGILFSGERLPSNQITYSLINTGSHRWEAGGIDAIEQALESWESVANIEFIPVNNNDFRADFQFKLEDNSFFDDSYGSGTSLGEFSPPGEDNQGVGIFNAEELEGNLDPGSIGFKVLIHELGHGLGLGHPHDTSKGLSTTFPDIPNNDADNTGANGLNQGVWTIMSYNNGLNDRGFASTPMALDIAAIQHLYGANPDYASGNNTYMLSELNSYQAIWDTGGNDTISAIRLGLGVDAQIDLRDAPLTGANAGGYISSAEDASAGFTIANGVEIENASGGLYNDTLTGNELDNTLSGQGGQDYLFGLGGNDTLLGGYGDDVLLGVNPSSSNPGFGEYDELTGGGGADIFALGDRSTAFYEGNGYTTITDFDSTEGDKIRAFGSLNNYTFADVAGGTNIFYEDDLIGHLEEMSNISPLDFEFV